MNADERYYAAQRAQKAADFSDHCRAARSAPDFRTERENLIDRYEEETGESYRAGRRCSEEDGE